jgi:hypothetical protein
LKIEDFLGGGYKVYINKKAFKESVVFCNDNPHELQAFLDVISEKREPPNNKTSIIAGIRVKGFKVNRFHVDCDIEMLKRLNLINTTKDFSGINVKPNYSNAKVKQGVVYFD